MAISKKKIEQMQAYIRIRPSATIERIANKFQVGKSTVQRLIKRGVLEYKPKVIRNSLAKEKVERVIRWNKELNLKELAKKLNVSWVTLWKFIKAQGIAYDSKRGNFSKGLPRGKAVERLKFIDSNLMTIGELARHYNVKYSTMWNFCKKYKRRQKPKKVDKVIYR
jgi:transposase